MDHEAATRKLVEAQAELNHLRIENSHLKIKVTSLSMAVQTLAGWCGMAHGTISIPAGRVLLDLPLSVDCDFLTYHDRVNVSW
jgi:hypothetical protein